MEDRIAISRLKQGDLTGLESLVNRYQVQAVHAAYLIVYVPVMLAEVDTMRALFPGSYDAWAAAGRTDAALSATHANIRSWLFIALSP